MKPRNVAGNSIPDKDVWMRLKTEDDRESDAPVLSLLSDAAGRHSIMHTFPVLALETSDMHTKA